MCGITVLEISVKQTEIILLRTEAGHVGSRRGALSVPDVTRHTQLGERRTTCNMVDGSHASAHGCPWLLVHVT